MDKITISTFQLFQMFPDKESARVYFESRMWPQGVRCPVCRATENITTRKRVGFYRCNQCHEDFTVCTGTIFERSHIPLHKWLYAMYLLVTARKGISSLQLSKQIGVTQKTAWFMLHRLRPHARTIGRTRPALARSNHCGRNTMNKTPKVLDAVADKVLAYRPKPKSEPAKKRQRKRRNLKRRDSNQ